MRNLLETLLPFLTHALPVISHLGSGRKVWVGSAHGPAPTLLGSTQCLPSFSPRPGAWAGLRGGAGPGLPGLGVGQPVWHAALLKSETCSRGNCFPCAGGSSGLASAEDSTGADVGAKAWFFRGHTLWRCSRAWGAGVWVEDGPAVGCRIGSPANWGQQMSLNPISVPCYW